MSKGAAWWYNSAEFMPSCEWKLCCSCFPCLLVPAGSPSPPPAPFPWLGSELKAQKTFWWRVLFYSSGVTPCIRMSTGKGWVEGGRGLGRGVASLWQLCALRLVQFTDKITSFPVLQLSCSNWARLVLVCLRCEVKHLDLNVSERETAKCLNICYLTG